MVRILEQYSVCSGQSFIGQEVNIFKFYPPSHPKQPPDALMNELLHYFKPGLCFTRSTGICNAFACGIKRSNLLSLDADAHLSESVTSQYDAFPVLKLCSTSLVTVKGTA